MTVITKLSVAGTDRKADHTGPIVVNRSVNAVGGIEFILDNADDTYDSLFTVDHDLIELDIDNVPYFVGHISNVKNIGRDDQGMFEKYIKVNGVCNLEELMFQDDFEKNYSDETQTISSVLNNVFNGGVSGTGYRPDNYPWYHLSYANTGEVGAAGAFEKKRGTSLLTFLQQLHKARDYLFYVVDPANPTVSDVGAFTSKSLAGLTSSGVTLSTSNLIGDVDYLRESSAKLFNHVELFGKSPMFDAYTEYNKDDWVGWGAGNNPVLTDESTTKRVGAYSIKITKHPAGSGKAYGVRLNIEEYARAMDTTGFIVDADNGSGKATITASSGTPFSNMKVGQKIRITASENGGENNVTYAQGYFIDTITNTVLTLNIPLNADNPDDDSMIVYHRGKFNHPTMDFSKGVMGCWAYYDGGDDDLKLTFGVNDESGNTAVFTGSDLKLYKGYWGWCEATLGIANQVGGVSETNTWIMSVGTFDWNNVTDLYIYLDSSDIATEPNYWCLDGLSLPIPAIGYASEGSFTTTNHHRAFVDSRPDLQTQNALQKTADTLLAQYKNPVIKQFSGMFAGTTSLRYAGTTVSVNFPKLAITPATTYYVNELTTFLQPRGDAGKNHDFVQKIDCVLVNQIAYDNNRLDIGGKPYNIAGVGLTMK